MLSLFRYAQVRCLYDIGSFWEPHLAEAPAFAQPAAGGSGLVTLGA